MLVWKSERFEYSSAQLKHGAIEGEPDPWDDSSNWTATLSDGQRVIATSRDEIRAAEGVQRRFDAKEEIALLHAKALRILSGNVTVEERDTWPTKLRNAEAIVANTATDFQVSVLQGEADRRGITVLERAQYILLKAKIYDFFIGQAGELRVAAEEDIDSADASAIEEVIRGWGQQVDDLIERGLLVPEVAKAIQFIVAAGQIPKIELVTAKPGLEDVDSELFDRVIALMA